MPLKRFDPAMRTRKRDQPVLRPEGNLAVSAMPAHPPSESQLCSMRGRPTLRAFACLLLVLAALVPFGTAAADPAVRLYAIRGFAGVAFSRGMNQLCDEVARMPQVICSVEEHYRAADIEPQAAQAVASGQKLVLVGHSWGAHAALNIAAAIKGNVSLLVTIDPNWFPTPPRVPPNVEIALNYYQDVDVLGRAVLQPSPAFRGQFQQFRRSEGHVLIDRSPEIHAEILARIRSILASQTPPQKRVPDTKRRKR